MFGNFFYLYFLLGYYKIFEYVDFDLEKRRSYRGKGLNEVVK